MKFKFNYDIQKSWNYPFLIVREKVVESGWTGIYLPQKHCFKIGIES